MGVGKASTQQPSLLEGAVRDLDDDKRPEAHHHQGKEVHRAFKLRQGNAIGAKVTLRGDRMWEFFDRLISLAIPRVRDFRGLPPEGLRRPRQLHLRGQRATDIPRDRVRQDRRPPGHGHDDRDHGPHERRRAGVCWTRSVSRSARKAPRDALSEKVRPPGAAAQGSLLVGRQRPHGQKGADNKVAAQTQVQGPGLHEVPPVRAAALRAAQVRAVPYLPA